MNPTLYIVLIILFFIAIKKFCDERERHNEMSILQYEQEVMIDKESKRNSTMNNDVFKDLDTPTMVKHLLGQLNCQYQISEDGKNFTFKYQGETFMIRASIKDSLRIRLYDMSWFHCPLDDIEEWACMQKAINKANGRELCTAVYFIDNDDNLFITYSRADLFIWNDMPYPEKYLLMWIDNMSRLKQTVFMEFEKTRQTMAVK